ncbi:hypothetical protein ACFU5K_23755, partial [Streptomyces sp. NPDC057428]
MTDPIHPLNPSASATRHVVFVTWKAGNAPAFEAAKRLGHHVTLIRSLLMEQAQNIDFEVSPYAQYPGSAAQWVSDESNWASAQVSEFRLVAGAGIA